MTCLAESIKKTEPIKILIVDDEEMILKMLHAIILKKVPGCISVHAEQVHTAEDAINSIAEFQPDLILLDHSYDKNATNGLDVIKGIKENGMINKIAKIISITSDITVIDEYFKQEIKKFEWINKLDFEIIINVIIKFINNCLKS